MGFVLEKVTQCTLQFFLPLELHSPDLKSDTSITKAKAFLDLWIF